MILVIGAGIGFVAGSTLGILVSINSDIPFMQGMFGGGAVGALLVAIAVARGGGGR